MFRVITIGREYGSGGSDVAAALARKLDWKLLDNAFITEVAHSMKVDPDLARRFDERIDSWVHRVSKGALWHGGFERVVPLSDRDVFDGETMAALSRKLVEQAAELGNYVIVGRGAQCILQERDDTFHVFVYAPMHSKVDRVRQREGDMNDIEDYIRSMDKFRCDYVRMNYGCKWTEPHLYNMMICSTIGEDAVSDSIIRAAGLHAQVKQPVGATPEHTRA